MGEKIRLNEFDILGVIDLNDVRDAIGIEKYLTPVIENGKTVKYLSRSKEYYNVKSMTELATERENLGYMLTNELSKRNFVIIENMLNCSGKVFFKKFEQYIASDKGNKEAEELVQAKECMMEDVKNMLSIFENRGYIQFNSKKRLPGGQENAQKRAIEMDNKALLYIFAKALKMKRDSQNIEVLTPGYGSIYIGPFLQAMYGYSFTNILKSKYIEESNDLSGNSMKTLTSSNRPFEEGKTVLLLDDNIGTGQTMSELRKSLRNEGVQDTTCGAVQYNWRNYYRVSVGEKTGIGIPDIQKIDILTPFNYAGHKLYKHAIDQLHSSGSEYIKYLQSKSYRKAECCDIEGSVIRSATSLSRLGVELPVELEKYVQTIEDNTQFKEILPEFLMENNKITNPISLEIIKRIVGNVDEISGKTEPGDETNGDTWR